MRMSLGENAKMALDTLRENKVRSFLTVLGVVIGITALITVSSILVGFYADVTAYLDDYGPNTVWIFKVAPGVSTGRMTAEERNRKPLTLEDAQAIREQCPAVLKVSVDGVPARLRLESPATDHRALQGQGSYRSRLFWSRTSSTKRSLT